jgi:solute carrier family 25 protein 16
MVVVSYPFRRKFFAVLIRTGGPQNIGKTPKDKKESKGKEKEGTDSKTGDKKEKKGGGLRGIRGFV